MRADCFAVAADHKLNTPSDMFEIETGAGKPKRSVVTGIVMCILAASAGWAQTNSSAWEWTTASPESQGMSSTKLKAMTEALAARSTSGLLVIRNDKIVCEWYASGAGPTIPHGTASMAKAIVGGVALAVAITDGRVKLDDKAAKFIRQWQSDPRKLRITFRQLGSHTSGLADAEADGLPHDMLSGWQGDFWRRLDPPRDPFTISRDITPPIFEPGERFQYSNPGIGMLVYGLTAALKDAPQKDIRALLRERVMRPIGVPDAEWSAGYNQTFTVDGLPLVAAWGGGNYTARAVAHRPAHASSGRLGRETTAHLGGGAVGDFGCRHAGTLRRRLVEQQRGSLRKAAERRVLGRRLRPSNPVGGPESEAHCGAQRRRIGKAP
jgi:CubicO group peptidase (beta-lactamase class C family)